MELTRGYWPGSPLARVPAGLKLAALAVLATAVIVIDTDLAIGVLTAITVLVLLVARLPPSASLTTLRMILPFVIAIVLFEGLTGNLHSGIRHGVRLVDLVLLAMVVTATSSFHEMMDTITALLRPLRRLGVDPDAVALAAGMTMRFIPLLVAVTAQTRDAYRVRGVRPRVHELLFPVLRRALLMAREVGIALTAREPQTLR